MNPDDGNALVPNNKPDRPAKELKQFEGVTPVKRKPINGFLKWTSSMFFSGRSWSDILKDLYEHQIVPEVKSTVRNTIVSIVDAKLSDSNISSTAVNATGNFLTRYIDYSAKAATSSKLSENKKKNEEIKKSGFEMPSFTDWGTAKGFLDSMKAEANRFGQLSVYDIAWKQGKTIDWTWDAYGWTKDMINAIKEPKRLYPPVTVNGEKRCYVIEMPNAILLEE